jgi:hypothetical protein
MCHQSEKWGLPTVLCRTTAWLAGIERKVEKFFFYSMNSLWKTNHIEHFKANCNCSETVTESLTTSGAGQ